MDMKMVWKWLYIGGALVAALAGAFSFSNDILTQILIVIGFLVGLLYFDSADLMNFGVRYLALGAAYMSMDKLMAVGSYITGFFGGFFMFLGPVVLGMGLMFIWKKYFAGGMK